MSETTPLRPREFDFRSAVLRTLLFTDPLRGTSVYVLGFLALVFLIAAALFQFHQAPWVPLFFFVTAGGFGLYVLWWLWAVAEALRGVRRGQGWLELGQAEIRDRRLYLTAESLKGTEGEFARLVAFNRITRFSVDNGRLRTQGKVEIEIDWWGQAARDATLYLYCDKGGMQDDMRKLRTRSSATCLVVAREGEPVRYVQAEVKADDNYNYYAWIEVTFHTRLILSAKTYGHWTRRVETPPEYYKRTKEAVMAGRAVNALRNPEPPPPPPLSALDRKIEFIRNKVKEADNKKEEDEIIEREIRASGFDKYAQEEMREQLARGDYK